MIRSNVFPSRFCFVRAVLLNCLTNLKYECGIQMVKYCACTTLLNEMEVAQDLIPDAKICLRANALSQPLIS